MQGKHPGYVQGGNILHWKSSNGFITIRRCPDDVRRRSDANLSCPARSSHARPGCSVYDRSLMGSRPDGGRPRRVPSGCCRHNFSSSGHSAHCPAESTYVRGQTVRSRGAQNADSSAYRRRFVINCDVGSTCLRAAINLITSNDD